MSATARVAVSRESSRCACMLGFSVLLVIAACDSPVIGARHHAVDSAAILRTMMQAIAQKGVPKRVEPIEGSATTLLRVLDLSSLSATDGWNRPIQYRAEADGSLLLTSYGADGMPGPVPEGSSLPADYDRDIVVKVAKSDGWFVQDWTGLVPNHGR